MRRALLQSLFYTAVCMLHIACVQAGSPAKYPAGKRPLTVADSIETTRAMTTADGRSSVFVSPDGSRYAVMLIKGDIQRSLNEARIISGKLDSIATATQFEVVATLSTTSNGSMEKFGADKVTLPVFNTIKWLPDNERIAFLWSDGKESSSMQLMTVDVLTHRVERLTDHPTDVLHFDISRSGDVFYTAPARRGQDVAQQMLAAGFSVGANQSVLDLLYGDLDGYSPWANLEKFISTGKPGITLKVVVNGSAPDRWWPRVAAFSPDGHTLVADGSPARFPAPWKKYSSDVYGGLFNSELRAALLNPDDSGQLKQLFIVDVKSGSSRPLWNAPNVPTLIATWSPDSRSLLLGPTFLPEAADVASLTGKAVVEIDVASGLVSRVPITADLYLQRIVGLEWIKPDRIQLRHKDGTKTQFVKRAGRWHPSATIGTRNPLSSKPVFVELRQGLNQPPMLFAVDKSSDKEQMILDLNPGLREKFSLGRVEMAAWKDSSGTTWNARLYYPVNYSAGRRYPLVVQTHGYASAEEFSLYGFKSPGLGPSYSPFAAQALANREMVVLQVEDHGGPGIAGTPHEPRAHLEGYEAGIESLVSKGLVDRERVGLSGYSRSGWYVEYILSHSNFPYAAALVADNFNASYLKAILGRTQGLDGYTRVIGSPPFGTGLKDWLERAPGFNADKINTPLQLQTHSAGLPSVLQEWELFNALRNLGKPAELYIIPDIQHGTHGLQNPEQCLASQQRAVDWFDFWLNGHESTDPKKSLQYEQWRKLRVLHSP